MTTTAAAGEVNHALEIDVSEEQHQQ